MKVEGGNPDSNSSENREKERERRGRGARGSRFSDLDTSGGGGGGGGGGSGNGGGGGGGVGGGNSGGNGNRDRSRERRNCRVYISNIPYDYRWQDLKDLFRRVVGSVEYVELFHDENGKARGCGIVEFKDPDNVEKALEKMNRYEINGRELVVKEDHGEQRDQYGRIVRDGAGGGRVGGNSGDIGGDRGDRGFGRRDDDRLSGRNNFNMMSNDYNNSSNYNLYGLSASFLESLGITGPLHNKVFVANLDYKVDSKKLKQVFKLAGKVQSVDLSVDKEGNSRGFAVVEYDHPVEAVQAISMLDRQMLYDRRMTVRLDRIPDKSEGLKLPEGLGGVGIGLGPNGEPLKDVARNLPNIIQQQQQQQGPQSAPSQQQMPSQGAANILGSMVSGLGGNGSGGVVSGSGMFSGNVQPSPVAPVVQASKPQSNLMGNSAGSLNLGNLSSTNLAALTNVVGGLGAALSNPLLTTSLSNLGLNLGQGGGGLAGNDDSQGNSGLSNNYSTGGNNYSSGFGTSSGFNSGGGGNSGGGSSFNSYNSGGGGGGGGGGNSGVGGGSGGTMDNNDYNTGNMDMYGGGGGGGGNTAGGNNPRKSDTIIIKNIPLSCTWQTLRDKFRDVGEVKFAEIRGNDLGVVRFFKERDAELAIALMDGSRMDGRTIKVTYF